MDPLDLQKEDIKKRVLRSAFTQWQLYMDQVEDEKDAQDIIQKGLLTGRSVTRLTSEEGYESEMSSGSESNEQANLLQANCFLTAEKIASHPATKALCSYCSFP